MCSKILQIFVYHLGCIWFKHLCSETIIVESPGGVFYYFILLFSFYFIYSQTLWGQSQKVKAHSYWALNLASSLQNHVWFAQFYSFFLPSSLYHQKFVFHQAIHFINYMFKSFMAVSDGVSGQLLLNSCSLYPLFPDTIRETLADFYAALTYGHWFI